MNLPQGIKSVYTSTKYFSITFEVGNVVTYGYSDYLAAPTEYIALFKQLDPMRFDVFKKYAMEDYENILLPN